MNGFDEISTNGFDQIAAEKPQNGFDQIATEKPRSKADPFYSLLNEDARNNPILSQTPAQQERGQVMTESLAQGMFGVKPSSPELQAKYPGTSFISSVAGGLAPYAAPGGTLLKFTAIPAAHEIIRQATTSEEDLNLLQRTSKVGTAAVFGNITGRLFGASDLLKTVAQRVASKGVAGGATSFADSLAQDALSGKDPDLHSAVANAAVNASIIGLLGSAVEIPSLRSAVIEEGSKWAKKPVSFEEAKAILKKQDINPEELSPTFRAAFDEAKKASVIKSADKLTSWWGANRGDALAVLREKTRQGRLNAIDEIVYKQLKAATGRSEVPEWRNPITGEQEQQYAIDYSKMNPRAAEQIKTLLAFRKEIAAGADPYNILWNQEVFRQLNPKTVKTMIVDSLRQNSRDVKTEYAKQIASVEKPTLQPTEFFNPGKIESIVGNKESLRTYRPDNAVATKYMPYLQLALEGMRNQQANLPPEQQRNIPTATDLHHVLRDELLKDVQLKLAGNYSEQDIVSYLQNKLSSDFNNPLEVYTVKTHQEQEDAADSPIYDKNNLREVSIAKYAADLRRLSDLRVQAGLPAINPEKDITVHRSIYKGQKGGIAKQVREAIVREYRKQLPLNPPKPTAAQPAEVVTPPPVPLDQATQAAGDQAAINIAADKVEVLPPVEERLDFLRNQIGDLENEVAHGDPDSAQRLEDLQREYAMLEKRSQQEVQVLGSSTEIPTVQSNVPNITPEVKESLPAIHEEHRLEQNKEVRKVVENLYSAEDLAKMAEKLQLSGTPEQRMEQLSQAAGISLSELKAILKPTVKVDYKHELTELDLKEDVETELYDILTKLEDWYEGINNLSQKYAIEGEASQETRDLRKADAKTLFKQQRGYAMGSSDYAKRAGIKSKKDIQNEKWLEAQRQYHIERIGEMAKHLESHREFLGKVYLNEIKSSLEGMASKAIIQKAIKDLTYTSTDTQVLFASQEIKSAIREAQLVISSEKRRELDKQKQDLQKDAEVDKDWKEFQKEDPDAGPAQDESYESDDKPWQLGEQGQVLNPAKLPVRIKILKHTEAERNAPMFAVMKIIRDFPLLADLRKRFILQYHRKKEEAELRNFFKVQEDVHSALFDTAMYLDAVKDISWEELQPISEDILANVKEWMKLQGIKTDKEAVQARIDALASLILPHASEQIMVKAFDPNNYGWTELGNGPHKSANELQSYIKHVKMAYDYFKIPVQDQIPEGNPDNPDGTSNTPGTLRHSRSPVFWSLLKHPNVMHNNSLERAVLFWKAQIEQAALDAQVKEGIYANADIVQRYIQGYHKSIAREQYWQDMGKESFKSSPLSGIQRPDKEYRSQAEFLDESEKQGLLPVNDWFNNNYGYLIQAMTGIKQAQLLRLAGSKFIPNLEYYSADFVKVLKDNPTPYKFHLVEHATNPNVIEEAKRMSKLLGREVAPMQILLEGGWKEGNAEWGLNKWYRGGFSAPFLYAPFAEEVKTIFRQHRLGQTSLGQIARVSQMQLTMSPFDNITYLSGAMVERPSWQVPFYLAGLPARALFHAGKGLVSTGPKIRQGSFTSDIGKNEYERLWARLFIENGSTSIAGFKSFLKHQIDLNDRGLYPWRQGKLDNLVDYWFSGLGMSQEVIGEMIAHDVLQAMIRIAENEYSKGMSVQEAARFTANYMNTASWNIHRVAYQGRIAELMSLGFISRNFLVNLVRIPMIISSITPVGKPVKKLGGYNFKTSGGAPPAISELQNVIMGADVPEEYREKMAWKLLGTVLQLAFWSIFIKQLIQYSISLMHDREDKKNLFENPQGTAGRVWLGIQDPLGHDIYADWSAFKLINNLVDFWAPVYDPIANSLLKATHLAEQPNVAGRGPVEVIKSKFGFIPNLVEAMFDSTLYDPSRDAWAQNTVRFLQKTLGGSIPANPVAGSGALPYEYSADTIENNILMALSMGGMNISRSYDQPIKELQEKVKSARFRKDEINKQIYTASQAAEAFRKGDIAPSQFRQKIIRQANPVVYFLRQNKQTIMEK